MEYCWIIQVSPTKSQGCFKRKGSSRERREAVPLRSLKGEGRAVTLRTGQSTRSWKRQRNRFSSGASRTVLWIYCRTLISRTMYEKTNVWCFKPQNCSHLRHQQYDHNRRSTWRPEKQHIFQELWSAFCLMIGNLTGLPAIRLQPESTLAWCLALAPNSSFTLMWTQSAVMTQEKGFNTKVTLSITLFIRWFCITIITLRQSNIWLDPDLFPRIKLYWFEFSKFS